jgi:branched-chain amino acid transport system ATP-binding protein
MNILQVAGVSKLFGGLRALDSITFDMPEGQVLGIIGPNGAGKTTLFNVINGVHKPDAGRIIFHNQDITAIRPDLLARLGLARTHQIVRPLNDLTVRQNVMAGACFGRENQSLRHAGPIADEVLEFVGLASHSRQLAGSLNVAEKKRLEMARALAAHPYLLLLDEVLAGLNPSEVETMVAVIRQVQQRGVSIIMIEHVMQAITQVSNRLIVLNYGQQIADGSPAEVMHNTQVVEAYLGDPQLVQKLLAGENHDAPA